MPAIKVRFLTAPRDLQSKFGDGYKARVVGLQGLPEIKARFLVAPGNLQSEFGDGYGARVVGLQGRPGLETYKVSLMASIDACIQINRYNLVVEKNTMIDWGHILAITDCIYDARSQSMTQHCDFKKPNG